MTEKDKLKGVQKSEERCRSGSRVKGVGSRVKGVESKKEGA